METYKVIFSRTAIKQINDLERSEPKAYSKLKDIIEELKEHPRSGVGKPEKLRYQKLDIWSRRLDRKNRITYSIDEQTVIVEVLSALGHYEDK